MMRLTQILSLALFSALFMSCHDNEDKKMIVGQWNASQWLVEGNPSNYDLEGASFTFDDNRKYSFTYSGNIESGTYFLSNNQLFTTPDGGIKMMVKVAKLTPDTLIMDMNRGGQPERLTLVKK